MLGMGDGIVWTSRREVGTWKQPYKIITLTPRILSLRPFCTDTGFDLQRVIVMFRNLGVATGRPKSHIAYRVQFAGSRIALFAHRVPDRVLSRPTPDRAPDRAQTQPLGLLSRNR